MPEGRQLGKKINTAMCKATISSTDRHASCQRLDVTPATALGQDPPPPSAAVNNTFFDETISSVA
jgi:hypothetical protein